MGCSFLQVLPACVFSTVFQSCRYEGLPPVFNPLRLSLENAICIAFPSSRGRGFLFDGVVRAVAMVVSGTLFPWVSLALCTVVKVHLWLAPVVRSPAAGLSPVYQFGLRLADGAIMPYYAGKCKFARIPGYTTTYSGEGYIKPQYVVATRRPMSGGFLAH